MIHNFISLIEFLEFNKLLKFYVYISYTVRYKSQKQFEVW